jgi:pseudaminic acid cytidylyltransferase
MRLCVIPARGGSKRITRKNIKSFCGQLMIGYSIKAAITSKCFDEIIVSTDDSEIAEIAKSFGASVPFMRPDELANDYTATIPVIKHAIEWFDDQGQPPYEVCCLYATAPFVSAGVIRRAYEQMQSTKADYCFTTTSFAFPIQRAIKITAENRIEMFYPEHFETRSQDLEESYHDAGQFYWGKAEAFKQQKSLFSKGATPYILPRHLVQDVDTPEDWKRAELMYQVLKKSGELG